MRIYTLHTARITGISLLEVLISILLLSIGIFGALKLQMHALIITRQSAYAGTALDLADELATSMRSNQGQMRADGSSSYLNIDYRADRDPINDIPACFANACLPTQRAAADIAGWLTHLKAQLPNVRAVVCRDSHAWDHEKERLRWECSADRSDQNVVVAIKLGWTDTAETGTQPAPRLSLPVFPEFN